MEVRHIRLLKCKQFTFLSPDVLTLAHIMHQMPKVLRDGFVVAVARLFTPEIASFYEEYYERKGIQFKKGNVIDSFESNDLGQVLTTWRSYL